VDVGGAEDEAAAPDEADEVAVPSKYSFDKHVPPATKHFKNV